MYALFCVSHFSSSLTHKNRTMGLPLSLSLSGCLSVHRSLFDVCACEFVMCKHTHTRFIMRILFSEQNKTKKRRSGYIQICLWLLYAYIWFLCMRPCVCPLICLSGEQASASEYERTNEWYTELTTKEQHADTDAHASGINVGTATQFTILKQYLFSRGHAILQLGRITHKRYETTRTELKKIALAPATHTIWTNVLPNAIKMVSVCSMCKKGNV